MDYMDYNAIILILIFATGYIIAIKKNNRLSLPMIAVISSVFFRG